MQIGYARVSTPDQSFTLQRDALEQSGCTKVFQEVASGAKTARPALTAALEYMGSEKASCDTTQEKRHKFPLVVLILAIFW